MNEIMAALMGVCWHEATDIHYHQWGGEVGRKCKHCGHFWQGDCDNPSFHDSQGRMTYEVMDWASEKMPETWELYCRNNTSQLDWDNKRMDECYLINDKVEPDEFVSDILSLANFLHYLRTHLEDWAMEDCPDKEMKNKICIADMLLDCPHSPDCVGSDGEYTGKIINPEFAKGVGMLKKWKA